MIIGRLAFVLHFDELHVKTLLHEIKFDYQQYLSIVKRRYVPSDVMRNM